MSFHVYILKCSDGSYYTGHTDNIEHRVSQHNKSEIPGYTSKRLPVEVLFAYECGSRDEALHAERQIKNWTRKKKDALIAGDWHLLQRLARKIFL